LVGVTTALVGMKGKDHVDENLKLVNTSPIPLSNIPNCFKMKKVWIGEDDLMRED